MYTYEERMRAMQLYIQYDLNMAATIRELGYPSRGMLYNWHKEFVASGDLREDKQMGYAKYTREQRMRTIEYYSEHGRSISRTIKALGYPKRTALREWLKEDLSDEALSCVTSRSLIKYTPEQREWAVIQFCSKERTAKEIRADIGVSESSLHTWKRRLLSERCSAPMPNKRTKEKSGEPVPPTDQGSLVDEKQVLLQQVDELKMEVHRLQMERDILEKAGEILKKGEGINLETLTNQEKAVPIDALRDEYRLKALLAVLDMAKSSYCYQKYAMSRPDKHAELRSRVKEIFTCAYNSYGYRRIHAVVRREGLDVSEKVLRL